MSTVLDNPCKECKEREGQPISLLGLDYTSLCPICVQSVITGDAANTHLNQVVEGAIRSWLATWATNPVYVQDRNELIGTLLDCNDFERIAMEQLGEFKITPEVRRKVAVR